MQASFTILLNQAPEENLAVIYAFGAVRDDESLRAHRGADVSRKPQYYSSLLFCHRTCFMHLPVSETPFLATLFGNPILSVDLVLPNCPRGFWFERCQTSYTERILCKTGSANLSFLRGYHRLEWFGGLGAMC
jgi:hypothetical protein